MANEVIYEIKDKVAWITLNRPEKRNAIDPAMRDGLFEAIADVQSNPEVWAAVFKGAGDNFSSGHDLVSMASGGRGRGRETSEMYLEIQNTWKPTFSAIDGYCLAQGGGIALSCDIRIATERAVFGWPQVKRGISSISGPVLLCQRIPLNIALEMLFTGDFIDAQMALKHNLVNKLVPTGKLMEETEAIVGKITANAPSAIRAIKEVAIRGMEFSLEERIRFGNLVAGVVMQTEDAKEGLAAFAEKRAPVWKGK